VNSGKTVFGFIKAIQNIDKYIRIVVVAGVIYEPTVSGQNIARNLGFFPSASFVALRLSKNQFTGSGATDTGNRLFNTLYLC
jgi:hypothetical protein